MPFYNYALTSAGGSRVIADTYATLGRPATIKLLDDMKSLGFKRSTLAGLSFGVTDIRTPESKQTILERRPEEGRQHRKELPHGRHHRSGALFAAHRSLGPRPQAGHRRPHDRPGKRLPRRKRQARRPRCRQAEGLPEISQPHQHDGHQQGPRFGRPDASARRNARPDGQALRRNHRNAHQGQFPRRPLACWNTSPPPTAPARDWPTRP